MLQTSKIYCPYCGATPLIVREAWHQLCQSCDRHVFRNPVSAVWCYLIRPDGAIWLSRRAHDPRQGLCDEPGWFCDITDESLESALARELHEELNLTLTREDLHYRGSWFNIYPYDGDEYPVMVSLYYSFVTTDQYRQIKVADDVAGLIRVKPDTYDHRLMTTPAQAQVTQNILDYIITLERYQALIR